MTQVPHNNELSVGSVKPYHMSDEAMGSDSLGLREQGLREQRYEKC